MFIANIVGPFWLISFCARHMSIGFPRPTFLAAWWIPPCVLQFKRKSIFFNCYLAAPWPNLGHSQGDSLTNPMLITAFFHIRVHNREPRNEVGSLSSAEHLACFEPETFRFLLQRLNPLGHSPQIKWFMTSWPLKLIWKNRVIVTWDCRWHFLSVFHLLKASSLNSSYTTVYIWHNGFEV